jgi:hypothetical protein
MRITKRRFHRLAAKNRLVPFREQVSSRRFWDERSAHGRDFGGIVRSGPATFTNQRSLIQREGCVFVGFLAELLINP